MPTIRDLTPDQAASQIRKIARQRDQYVAQVNGQILMRVGHFNGQIDVLMGLLADDDQRRQIAEEIGVELAEKGPSDGNPGDSPLPG